MDSILIVGPGRLGGQIAFHVLKTGVISKVFLVGRDYTRTKGIAADLEEAFPNCSIIPLSNYKTLEPVELTFFAFSNLEWSASIGVNDRLIEAKSNIKIIDQIASDADVKSLGTIIIISNPVDILTWYSTVAFKKENIFGFGISLDEYRVGATIERLLGIKCTPLPCLGEHGAHLVPLLSHCLEESQLTGKLYDQVRRETFSHTEIIIKHISIPFYGPLRELERALDMILLRKSGTLTMSRYLKEPFLGVSGIALGVPVIIEEGVLKGIKHLTPIPLEVDLFAEAAQSIALHRQSLFT